jgi:predicted MFS family arabinose efflux permease
LAALEEAAAGAATAGPVSPDTAQRVGAAQWYALALLTLIFVANQIDRSAISAVQEQLKHEFSLSDSQLGLLTGLVTGGIYGLCIIPLAMVADRMNRRNLIAVIMVIWSLATVASGFAGGFLALVVARMVVIGAESGTMPASTSLISDLFPPHRRASAVAIYYIAPSAGVAISFLFAGAIAQDFGWRNAFFLAGAPGLILATVLLFTFKEPARGAMDSAPATESGKNFGQALRGILTNPVLLVLFLGGTLATVASSTLLAWCASLLIRIHGMDLKSAGFAVAMTQGVISGLGMAATGPLADRVSGGDTRRALRFAAWTMLASTVTAAVFICAPDKTIAIAGLAACGLVCRSYLGPMISAVLNTAAPNRRALTVSVLNICTTCIGAGFGPLLTGALSDAFGGPHSLQPALLISVLTFVPAIALFVLAGEMHHRRKTASMAGHG